ncbi:MAG: hypothetical protein ACYTFT_11410 [Planctomycetota bacterium]|jgi:hypothetical protein
MSSSFEEHLSAEQIAELRDLWDRSPDPAAVLAYVVEAGHPGLIGVLALVQLFGIPLREAKSAWQTAPATRDQAHAADRALYIEALEMGATDALRDAGWNAKEMCPSPAPLQSLRNRYPWAEDFTWAFGMAAVLAAPDQKSWILTRLDYSGGGDSAFSWDEIERQSLAATGSDPGWASEVREFWDNHIPIALSVRDGYAYLAIARDGSIVRGEEPEFEETTHIAESYEQFLKLIEQRDERLGPWR